ncbi:hypothetical protein G3O06_07055 [Burkholderia sp. Ac-20345]|uniref:hypothetical protein n=1 Tax=Burkholderia sp. Ac-20345 TaxID=2703891 RepID=UPI00197B24D5|nr:hypothetical protein [Burkholderia sp. Ac-20345]MBN3777317.1 hypothetical protein [Burkholderia sp. Ac-20345]
MSLVMMIEMDRRVSADVVRQVLVRCGVDVLTDSNDGFRGIFRPRICPFLFEKLETERWGRRTLRVAGMWALK